MATPSFAAVDELLNGFVGQQSFPGATAIIADANGPLHSVAVGKHTYDASAPPMSTSTHFDVASLTKVVVTTTCAMLLFQWGDLKLEDRISTFFGPAFAASDKRKALITVEHLLLHAAGFPPDPTPVSYCAPRFACPEYLRAPPEARHLTFSCQHKAFASLDEQTLARAPGEKFVYSDLSMITMMHVVGGLAQAKGHVRKDELLPECVDGAERAHPPPSGGATAASPLSQCYYEAFARRFVFEKRGTPLHARGAGGFLGFRLPRALWASAAPTWNDTTTGFPGECVAPFRERVLQGEVSDGNAYALGGVAGHAGLFATAPQLHAVVSQLLFARAGTALGVNASTVGLFTRVHNASFSSRALGWDTLARADGTSLCGNMSARTFMHTGYTGTIICADPEARSPRTATPGLLTILLTNRVYPRADARSEHAIHVARTAFNDAVLKAVR